MERTKVIPGLRIAWSVWWGILCVLLVALWVRSYWWCDMYQRVHDNDEMEVVYSDVGRIGWEKGIVGGSLFGPPRAHGWERQRQKATDLEQHTPRWDGGQWSLPHYIPVGLFAILATAPWLRRRFSLRTLLIATTLIAVLLGLVVWLTKAPTAPPLDVGDFPADF